MSTVKVIVAWVHPCGSAGSMSMNTAEVAIAAAEVLKAEYPHARISVGGYIVREFAGVPA